MATNKINTSNLLPEVLRTDRNKKFLASTIDQLIQPAQLERLDGYIGSTVTPTYKPEDVYITNGKPYQLDPAMVTRDSLDNITDVQCYDDLINEIANKGGLVDNFDRLFRSKVYSYNAHIDWDKLVNYQYYYWLPQGPEILDVSDDNIDVEFDVIGKATASVYVGTTLVELSNGMMVEFSGPNISETYYNKTFFVEGVGTSIVLVPYERLVVSENFLSPYPDGFDSSNYDTIPYDNDQELPNLHAEYVTINRASKDLNPWSRYNRWVHQDVIKKSAEVNGVVPQYPSGSRAQRPIIEFKADIKLFNFGTIGLEAIDLFDTLTTDAFNTVEGSTSAVYIDGIELEEGHRVIFNVDVHDEVRGRIYEVKFVDINGTRTLTLQPAYDFIPVENSVIPVLYGNAHNGTDWYYKNGQWIFAQQRTELNQAPLFDLFDTSGLSYGDKDHYLSDFVGNKIFSYAEGTGTADEYLGFPLAYKNIEAIGSILFDNNLVTDKIVISQLGSPTYTVSASVAYCQINGQYENAWTETVEYPIPLLTSTATSVTSYYEEPLSLTNNPLNGTISSFTISELSEHVQSMIDRGIPGYAVSQLNAGNLRDLPDYTSYGIKLISNANPISFAQMFIGKKEHSLINALIKSADNYNQFKLTFLNTIISMPEQLGAVAIVDQVLTDLNQNKTGQFPYYLSDMLGYGQPEIVRSWTVTNSNNVSYPLNSEFDLSTLSTRAVYVYLNGMQLLQGIDYVFNTADVSVEFLTPLVEGDVIVINDYTDTEGAYIPPTPSKLGLYPKFAPSKYLDDTYATPTWVIQGHDGSIMVAYNDYRDDVVLELEKRIFNNIKEQYNSSLIDINTVIPGAFRTTNYSVSEVTEILQEYFVRWAGKYGIDYTTPSYFDSEVSKTWNYKDGYISSLDKPVWGSWRAISNYLYDTDKPHTHPWEMLGLSSQPDWWEDKYGPAPYTSGNLLLWQDLAAGNVNGTVNPLYVRPGLLDVIPVDEFGNLVDLTIENVTDSGKRHPWVAGDLGPAETAWRRSSYWPFAVQKLLALTIPASYTSLMYDLSRVQENISGQLTYGAEETFFKLPSLKIFGENKTLTSGYSVFVSEIGQARTTNYISELRQDLDYVGYNISYKVNGFVDQDTLQVIIDAYEPTSTSPGSVLPPQNYQLRLNVSNPIKSVGISGLIIQKLNGEYIVKGYDKHDSYFKYFAPIRNLNTPSITVGGETAEYVVWESSSTPATSSSLSAADTTTAQAAATGNFYQVGQYVYYGNNFYRVTVAHRSGATFNNACFQILPQLPTLGGATVQTVSSFGQKESSVPYGVSYTNIQDVYDLIVGYGRWLTTQGFDFTAYNKDFGDVVDWSTTAKEFLYWTTQNWDEGSVITLSPFADQIVYHSTDAVVDNMFGNFYDYSILRADGTPYPRESISVSRTDGNCVISTLPNTDGIYFARLNLVQKEHSMVFDNNTIFGDVIFDPETGSRQRRMKLVGFRTANWNGDYFSPGFVYDTAVVKNWAEYTDYLAGDVVRFGGKYYSAIKNVDGSKTFDFNKWDVLTKKPTSGLLPNFDYKINQFEDFYSLDVDNFDEGQQKMAQHLTGYTPRVYLNNIFTDPVAQYKFYQGYIREKGTKNAISKLAKATLKNLHGEISFTEEWAFRIGQYGSYPIYQELEVPLIEGTFLENPQIINFVDSKPSASENDLIHYALPADLEIVPDNYSPANTFITTSTEDAMLLSHAGYVRLDDVTATAYNENSLLDIANSDQLRDGDTIWLGFKQDGNWDVYRYTYYPVGVVGVYVSAPLSTITFATEYPHGLSVGQMVGVSHFNDQVNGIYVVKDIPKSDQFTVASTLASIENAPLPAPGQLYVFASARIDEFDSMPSDKHLFRLPYGTKFWIDGVDDNKWEVYEKIDNYNVTPFYSRVSPTAQGLGRSISKRSGSNIIVAGAPTYLAGNFYGRIYVYREEADGTLTTLIRTRLNNVTGIPTGFGTTVVYDDISFGDTTYGLTFVGAPVYQGTGIVKVLTIDPVQLREGSAAFITNPNSSIGDFGSSIFVERNTSSKVVLIGAPAGIGAVYSYTVSDVAGTIQISAPITLTDTTLTDGSQFGASISGAENASYVAVGAPGFKANTGKVSVFNKAMVKVATLTSPFGKNGRFGETVLMSADGSYLFVSAPASENTDGSLGSVAVYTNNNGTFTLDQTIENPVAGNGMQFGKALDVNEQLDSLVISGLGTNHTFPTTFDSGKTTFDGGITDFLGTEANSGAVYVYYRKNKRFVISQELTTSTNAVNFGTDYGISVALNDGEVLVGSPALDNTSIPSGFYKFNKKNNETFSWDLVRHQDDFVVVDNVRRVSLINTFKDEVVEYLDIIDPIKGKVAGIAEQELTYKLVTDPAIYSIGVAGTNNNTEKNWLDAHVGELWWDLSAVKYVWYEQSDLEYRRNNWGKLFPGATIDVYEWVGSALLPSEWAAQADTPKGLTKGISGQPKFADNSVISVKQVYDPISNSFTNVYYYWVKNKVTIPNAKNRRKSAYEVASIIADPSAYGLKFASIIDKDAVMLANVGSMIVDDRISLNIAQDVTTENNIAPRHTQWQLLQEGSALSMPPELLEKKMIDSLLGHDSLGNLVPSETLSERTRYGIGIRPQQTLFKNRLEALRNVVEFTNSVLIDIPVTGKYSFKNLNAQEEIPDQYSNLYDHLVEDNSELEVISTEGFSRAVIECRVNNNGEVSDVYILNPGHGYGTLNPVYGPVGEVIGYEGPVFTDISYTYLTTFDNNTTTFDGASTRFFEIDEASNYGRDLKVSTMVDETGSIVAANIVSSGKGYVSNFKLMARPQTVMVQSDDTYNGKWTRYEWNYTSDEWDRAHTQSYNTTLYWDYVDWASAEYDMHKIYSAVIGSPYELVEIELQEGQYVKINNGGDGRYIVLEKIADSEYGSYGPGYNIVYSQNGTIQISNGIWDLLNSGLGWDYVNTWDQTLWDQTADQELQYILKALKEDIFVAELKINWNLLFFKAVKYAMTEQKSLDWAFKTSFISVLNTAGELDQPPVYKLQDSSYYEDYIKEVKPYKTQIRNFTTKYSVVEPTNTEIIEQDRTSTITLKFDRVSAGNETGNYKVVDTFICNGIETEYVLNWVPNANKTKMVVKIDGVLVLSGNFTISYYTEKYNGYTKQFAKIVFLNYTPAENQVLTVEYEKSGSILNAAERILNYYTATSGMVGLDLAQLMDGIEYPGTQVGGLGFTTPWAEVNIDSNISGGTWTNGHLVSALGIDPEDIIIDGEYGFLTPTSGYAPEEVVPGYVTDSLGINVYTRGQSGPPIVMMAKFETVASTSTQAFALPQLPPTIESMSVICNGFILEYTTDTLTTDAHFYNIDWLNKKLVLPPQTLPGEVGFTILDVGGGSGTTFGIIAKESFYAGPASNASITLIADRSMIEDAFVTVNGDPINEVTTTTDYGYMLNEDVHGKCVLNVYNLPVSVGTPGPNSNNNTIQAWFFDESHEYYNEVREQLFVVDGTTSTFTLAYPPLVEGPPSTHAIVELTDTDDTRRLLPPDNNLPTVFDYIITGTNLIIEPSVVLNVGDTIKVITYSNHDDLGMQVDKFVGNPNRRFQITRPTMDDRYVWVTLIKYNGPGVPPTTYGLINSYDFVVLEDNVTVQISDDWQITTNDLIEIISYQSPDVPASLIGYRIFNDMLGGTSFTRISHKNSTYLTKPLAFTDTEIHVADSTVLTPPDVGHNIPGVILVNGERIEFFQSSGTVLSQLRRATLGTGPAVTLPEGTRIIDQGINQRIPSPELVHVQNTFTNTLTNIYSISKVSKIVHYPGTTATVRCDGITLSTASRITSTTDLSTPILPKDQVEVYYGGRLLRKEGMYRHDTTVTYDNISVDSIIGSTSTVSALPTSVNIGNAYLVEDTNEVWVYTGFRTASTSTNGYVYSGLKYYPEEFTVEAVPTQILRLNTATLDLQADVQITIVKKDFAASSVWNDKITPYSTKSLLDSTSTTAMFLKDAPAELPTTYYYSGDLVLTDEAGQPLQDILGHDLSGYY